MRPEHLDFITFCVGCLSDALRMSASQVYGALRSSGVLNDYIVPCYDVLHTFSKDYLVKELTEVLKEGGGNGMTLYANYAEEGSTKDDIAKSKKAMSSLEVLLGESERLDKLCVDIHHHYVASVEADPGRIQKAMIVCSNRQIAYNLLLRFKEHYPEWFVEKKAPEGMEVSPEELKKLKEMPMIAMVASVGSNDEPEMYNYLGGVKDDQRSDNLDAAFKQEHSNFRIVIVVDMWIAGFDVECLTYMYNDKPLQKHSLIQTISRVNRKYPGKEFGLIVGYIGIRDQMLEARKMYGGGSSAAPNKDDIEQATIIFREQLIILRSLFKDYDLTPFLDINIQVSQVMKTLLRNGLKGRLCETSET